MRAAPAPERTVRLRELDPIARCGADTSVEQLWRVDEAHDGRPHAVHLVYFDHHGWYCHHGRACAAVADVHRELRALRRAIPAPVPRGQQHQAPSQARAAGR